MLLPAIFITVAIAQQVSLKEPKTMIHYDPWAPQAATAIRARILEPIEDFASEPSPISDEHGRLFRFEPVTDVNYFEADIGGDMRPEVFLNNANAPLYLGSKEWVVYVPSPDGDGYIRFTSVLLSPTRTTLGEIEPTHVRDRIVSTPGPSLLQSFHDSERPDLIRAYYVKGGGVLSAIHGRDRRLRFCEEKLCEAGVCEDDQYRQVENGARDEAGVNGVLNAEILRFARNDN